MRSPSFRSVVTLLRRPRVLLASLAAFTLASSALRASPSALGGLRQSAAMWQAQPAAPPSTTDDPEGLTALARTRLAEGNEREAAELLERAITLSPNHPAANLLLGNLLLQQSRLPEAMDRFETVLRIAHDPDAEHGELLASTRLALSTSRAGNQEAAYRCLEHAAEFLPRSAELLTDLGLVAGQLGRYARAREALEQALAVEPNRSATVYALARVELDADHLADAEKQFRTYLALRPDDASAWYGLGRDLHRQQRDAEAEAALQRSVKVQPVQTEAYYELGAIALDAHRDAEAEGLFAKTLSRNPQHGGALTGMGELRFRAHNYPAAKEALLAAVSASPEYQPAHYYLGLTLARLGDKEASATELARATELLRQQQGKGQPTSPNGSAGPPP